MSSEYGMGKFSASVKLGYGMGYLWQSELLFLVVGGGVCLGTRLQVSVSLVPRPPPSFPSLAVR